MAPDTQLKFHSFWDLVGSFANRLPSYFAHSWFSGRPFAKTIVKFIDEPVIRLMFVGVPQHENRHKSTLVAVQ